MKKTIKKTASSAATPMPIARAGSTFSDSATIQPRPEFSVYGSQGPQSVDPSSTPQ